MRLRHTALGCALTAGLGCLALPAGNALAATGLANAGLANAGLASTGLASTGLASTGLANAGLASTGGHGRAKAAKAVGDAHGAAVSASRTLRVYARVTDRLGGYHGTTRSGGVVYDVFHGADTLTLHSTVAPNFRGECLEPESEQYDKGAGWDADTKYGCDKLDGASHDSAPFSLSLAVGDRYRMRGDYLRGRDGSKLNAQGPWLYFIVEK